MCHVSILHEHGKGGGIQMKIICVSKYIRFRRYRRLSSRFVNTVVELLAMGIAKEALLDSIEKLDKELKSVAKEREDERED